jgi:hypothetical protein
MLPTQPRHRTTIPATGLGSILVATPQLALVADRGVVAAVAVAVGMGEGSFAAVDRRGWDDVAAPNRVATGATLPVDAAAHDPAAAEHAPTWSGDPR